MSWAWISRKSWAKACQKQKNWCRNCKLKNNCVSALSLANLDKRTVKAIKAHKNAANKASKSPKKYFSERTVFGLETVIKTPIIANIKPIRRLKFNRSLGRTK